MHFWRNLSVTKKLYCVVGLMGFLIALELFTLLFAVRTLSAVRALVNGEALWSKAQKDAVHSLQKYAITKDKKHYELFEKHLSIPLGDRMAHQELAKTNMSYDRVFDGFSMGKIHSDDIPEIVNLLRRFSNIDYLKKAFSIWTEGDRVLELLVEEGKVIHQNIQAGKFTDVETNLEKIADLNARLTILEADFSSTLGENSRWLEQMLMIALAVLVFTVEGLGLFLTFRFGRSLSTQLKELKDFARRVGRNHYAEPPEVRSQDELGQLTEALIKMSEDLKEKTEETAQAEEASKIKSLFLANMSHEIRTPLSVILGFSELMKDADISQDERENYAGIVRRTGDNLTTIINDILDISKVEAGRIEIEKTGFSLSQLLHDLEVYMKVRFDEKSVALSITRIGEIPDHIVSDPTRLRQILLNIVGNAVKFTEKGQVSLTYGIESRYLTFYVKDSGVGITEVQRRRLFKSFSQGDSSIRRKFGGTGLGLILSRKLARLLGGDVTLMKSEPGVGSTFKIKILFQTAEALRPVQPPKDEVSAALPLMGKRILVVEDIPENQLLVRIYLNKSGAQTDFANNGLEGLQKLEREDYDLVLMDMQMPIMDGYTATSELRARGYNLPIVALTGHAMKEDREKCLKVGCNAYLTKPIDRPTLVNMVNTFTKKVPETFSCPTRVNPDSIFG